MKKKWRDDPEARRAYMREYKAAYRMGIRRTKAVAAPIEPYGIPPEFKRFAQARFT